MNIKRLRYVFLAGLALLSLSCPVVDGKWHDGCCMQKRPRNYKNQDRKQREQEARSIESRLRWQEKASFTIRSKDFYKSVFPSKNGLVFFLIIMLIGGEFGRVIGATPEVVHSMNVDNSSNLSFNKCGAEPFGLVAGERSVNETYGMGAKLNGSAEIKRTGNGGPLYFVTGSNRKFKEANSIIKNLRQVSLDYELPEIQSLNATEVIYHKLLTVLKEYPCPLIVEDVSFYIHALNGFPGPLIKFFFQDLGHDGVAELVQKYENKNATEGVFIGYCDENGSVSFYEGRQDGEIVPSRGEAPSGDEKIFQPVGQNKTVAEMSYEERYSHRARIKAFLLFLKKNPEYS